MLAILFSCNFLNKIALPSTWGTGMQRNKISSEAFAQLPGIAAPRRTLAREPRLGIVFLYAVAVLAVAQAVAVVVPCELRSLYVHTEHHPLVSCADGVSFRVAFSEHILEREEHEQAIGDQVALPQAFGLLVQPVGPL